ncbi:MAG: amino acid adenylation domain-containing protein [Pseudomonadota bacterium]
MDTLHRRVLAQADANPAAPAYLAPEERLSYADLLARAARLAYVLRDAGVQPGDPVGLMLPGSCWQAAAVQAVLRCGGLFVPIDPAAPTARLRAILEQAGISCLVASDRTVLRLQELDASVCQRLRVIGPARTEGVAASWSFDEVLSAPELAPQKPADDLAYLMFTSGSTGVPKGILHTHASGLAYVERVVSVYALSRADRIGNFAPLHFDISTLGYLAAPTIGAATVLIPDSVQLFPSSVARLVAAEAVTIWYSAPFALQRLLTHSDFRDQNLSALRWVLFGGEVFPPAQLAELMSALPGARFSNVYGPAEVNQCTYFHLPGPPTDTEAVPIGCPWADTHAVLRADDGSLNTGAGEGELLIATPTMMRGYWQRPDLDAQSFVVHGSPPRRYYRTGDRVQRDDAGRLYFRGRVDRQAKIRGYRVELDEVEALAVALDAVVECAALKGESERGEGIVVLFAQLASGWSAADAEEVIKRALSANLAAYAVPRRYVLQHEPLPRNSSAKLDRLALGKRLAKVATGS